jgi:hypothetical protein
MHVDQVIRLAPFTGTFNLAGGRLLLVSEPQNTDGMPLIPKVIAIDRREPIRAFRLMQ